MKQIEKYGFYTFFIAFLIALYASIDLNSRLNKVMAELVSLKSEDQFTKNRNEIIDDDLVTFDNQIIDENTIHKNKKEDKPDEVENSPQPKCEEKEERFLAINPKIDFDSLQKRYKVKSRDEKDDLRKLSTKEKKRRFIELVLPAIKESRDRLMVTYKNLLELKDSNLTESDKEYLDNLYKLYRIQDRDIDKLILAVKPHPISVILAQAALESGWGTSRFFREGSNIFGIWSFDENEERIKARGSNGVYLKKYDSYVESVDDYMLILGRSPKYEEFRKARMETDDPYELIQYLKVYSELRDEYVRRLRIVIKANKFTKFDKEN